MKTIFKAMMTVMLATGMLMTGIPVFASPAETPVKEPVREVPEGAEIVYAEDVNLTLEDLDNIVITEPAEEEETEEIAYGPLTPEGNLSLADDYGEVTGQGKQFITVTTRTGEYFYLIIDRDDSGNETVHFLNQVDNSDIMRYLEDEELALYTEMQSSLEERKAALEAEESALRAREEGEPAEGGDEASPSENETQDGTGKITVNPESLGTVVIFVCVGGAFFVYCIVSKKKKKQNAPKSRPASVDWDDEDEDAEVEPETDEE